MIVSTRSLCAIRLFFDVADRPNTSRFRHILSWRYNLSPTNHRSSRSEAIIANSLARYTPCNLSSALSSLSSTRHASRPNLHS
jgi:hypothetical protein